MHARSNRPLVVCLHSSGSTGRQWLPLAERLATSCDVAMPDLHGHGDGPAWHDEHGDILAADASLAVALARAAVRPVHLVGHSWGAAVALRAAREHPGRFASVTAYEPVLFRLLRDRGERHVPAALVAAIGRAVRADLRAGARETAARRFVDFWNVPGTFDALPALRQEAAAARMPAVGAQFVALWNDAAGLAAYRQLALPVRLFVGTQTSAAPRTIVELLATALPHVETIRMSAMGHMGPLTHPSSVAQSIAAFVLAQAFPAARDAAYARAA